MLKVSVTVHFDGIYSDLWYRNRCIQSTIDEGQESRANKFPLSPVLFINLLCHSPTCIFSPSVFGAYAQDAVSRQKYP